LVLLTEAVFGLGNNSNFQMGIEGECQKPRTINPEDWGLKEGIKKIACGHNFTVFLTGKHPLVKRYFVRKVVRCCK